MVAVPITVGWFPRLLKGPFQLARATPTLHVVRDEGEGGQGDEGEKSRECVDERAYNQTEEGRKSTVLLRR